MHIIVNDHSMIKFLVLYFADNIDSIFARKITNEIVNKIQIILEDGIPKADIIPFERFSNGTYGTGNPDFPEITVSRDTNCVYIYIYSNVTGNYHRIIIEGNYFEKIYSYGILETIFDSIINHKIAKSAR